MQKIEGNYGEVRICDYLDVDSGISSFEPKSFDLCITDPPYNLDACRNDQRKQYVKRSGKDIEDITLKYEDEIPNYENWCKTMYEAIMRVSNQFIITIGSPNETLWRKIAEPRDIVYHYKKNGNGMTALAWHNVIEPIFVYGKFDMTHKPFTTNVFNIPLDNGFLRLDLNLDHPHPKNVKLWGKLINSLNPSYVLDPFGGSGTTCQICEELGIYYLCYEINNIYVNDIEKRIKQGISDHKKIKKPKRLLDI